MHVSYTHYRSRITFSFGKRSVSVISRDHLASQRAKNWTDPTLTFPPVTIKQENHHHEKWQSNPPNYRPLIKPRRTEALLKLVALESPHPVMLTTFALGVRSSASISDNFTESQANTSAISPSPTNKCACCKIPETDPEKPLKLCAKCQTVRYCSRDCQKKDWKLHKKTCASAAQIYAQNANLKPASAPRAPKKEGHRGGLQKWQFDTWLVTSLRGGIVRGAIVSQGMQAVIRDIFACVEDLVTALLLGGRLLLRLRWATFRRHCSRGDQS
jgi:MYND finger